MKCDICHKREAVIELRIEDGESVDTFNLCFNCILNKIATTGFNKLSTKDKKIFEAFKGFDRALENSNLTLEEFASTDDCKDIIDRIDGYLGTEVLICPNCNTVFADIKEKHIAGCPKCYSVFEKIIDKELFNLNKTTRYRGKLPLNIDKDVKRSINIKNLKDKLSVAVNLEEYEEAAEITKKLKSLEEV